MKETTPLIAGLMIVIDNLLTVTALLLMIMLSGCSEATTCKLFGSDPETCDELYDEDYVHHKGQYLREEGVHHFRDVLIISGNTARWDVEAHPDNKPNILHEIDCPLPRVKKAREALDRDIVSKGGKWMVLSPEYASTVLYGRGSTYVACPTCKPNP